MKKFITVMIILILSLNIIYAMDIKNLENEAKAISLLSADTNQFLYQQNADTKLPAASTIKILTAIIIIEDMDLESEVTASENFINPTGSHIAIDRSETLKVKDLLYALLLSSANDAAIVLAEAHSGSVKDFTDIMNLRATEIGATNSHFANSSGLDAENNYTSANDLALIASYAMKNPTFREIVKTTKYTIAPTNKKAQARDYIVNHNLFLIDNGEKMPYDNKEIPIYDPRVDGIKTGYTDIAGSCLVSSLVAENSRYIVVVLGEKSQLGLYRISKAMLDYASENYKRVTLVEKGAVVDNIKIKGAEHSGLNLVAAESIKLTLPLTDEKEHKIVPIIEHKDAEYPITMGALLGQANYTLDDNTVVSVDLLAERDIKDVDFVGELTEILATKKSIDSYLDILIIIGKLCLVFLLWRIIIVQLRKRAKKKALTKAEQADNVVDFNEIKKNHPRPKQH